jgi:hypothetical protein
VVDGMPKWLEKLIYSYVIALVAMECLLLSAMPIPTVWEWLRIAFVLGPVTAIPLCLLLCLIYAMLGPTSRRRG